mmetsp:Transcript_98965/g.268765  ORF Transcript_98965/g.268765 Transcript_98965/m.268765 type:complete len:254 (+) Transcript_98965:535-1296(+)
MIFGPGCNLNLEVEADVGGRHRLHQLLAHGGLHAAPLGHRGVPHPAARGNHAKLHGPRRVAVAADQVRRQGVVVLAQDPVAGDGLRILLRLGGVHGQLAHLHRVTPERLRGAVLHLVHEGLQLVALPDGEALQRLRERQVHLPAADADLQRRAHQLLPRGRRVREAQRHRPGRARGVARREEPRAEGLRQQLQLGAVHHHLRRQQADRLALADGRPLVVVGGHAGRQLLHRRDEDALPVWRVWPLCRRRRGAV